MNGVCGECRKAKKCFTVQCGHQQCKECSKKDLECSQCVTKKWKKACDDMPKKIRPLCRQMLEGMAKAKR
jgi:hypothetical protein